MDQNIRFLERRVGDEDALLSLLAAKARLPGKEGELAQRKLQFLVDPSKLPKLDIQPWFDDAIQKQREFWINATSNNEINNVATETAIQEIYGQLRLGHCRPVNFCWFSSPYELFKYAGMNKDDFPETMINLAKRMQFQIQLKISRSISIQLPMIVRDKIQNDIGRHMREMHRVAFVDEGVPTYRSELEQNSFWGKGGAHWVAGYACARVLGACFEDSLLRPWETLAQSCNCWIPIDDDAVLVA